MTDVASTQQTAALFLSTIVTRTRRHRNDKKRKKTDKPDWKLFQITNLMHNSFILQQYVCYTAILNMFRTARCSAVQYAGGDRTQSALHLHTVRLFTEGDDTRGCGDTICPPEDDQGAARNMLRIAV